MNILKSLAGVLTFITALGLTMAVNRYFHVPFQTVTNESRVAILTNTLSSVTAEDMLLAQGITYQVKLVSLDFETRHGYTTLTLKRTAQGPAPEKLWLRTYYFVPGGAEPSWSSDTVELDEPFKSGNTVTLAATSPCDWCGQSSAPGDGYYARVYISTRSAYDVLRGRQQIDDDITTATPVLVQRGR